MGIVRLPLELLLHIRVHFDVETLGLGESIRVECAINVGRRGCRAGGLALTGLILASETSSLVIDHQLLHTKVSLLNSSGFLRWG